MKLNLVVRAAVVVVVIARHIDGFAIADIQLIGNYARRQKATAADSNNFVEISGLFDLSGEFFGMPVKIIPADIIFFAHRK